MPKKKTQHTKKQRTAPTEKEVQDAFVADICSSMEEAVRVLNSKEKLTLDKVDRPQEPKQFTASEIASIREKRLNLSQSLFALLLNVSLKTVQAWEQSVNKPSGAALRLLNIISEQPEDIKARVFGNSYRQ